MGQKRFIYNFENWWECVNVAVFKELLLLQKVQLTLVRDNNAPNKLEYLFIYLDKMER